jgi:mannobiose 2-epimerase
MARHFPFQILSAGTLVVALAAPLSRPADPDTPAQEKRPSAAEIEAEMKPVLADEFRLWYPLCVDTVDGGFLSDLDYAWRVKGAQTKMIVTQARHVWSIAHAASIFPEYRSLRATAEHGVRFLEDVMWDKAYGGFHDLVDREGRVMVSNGEEIKQAYGNAFAIYALAAYYRTWRDTSALHLAQETFRWLEAHSYDPRFGGYFQFLSREGKPFTEGYRGTPPKDQNSSIHLLESFTELYSVWPDPLVRARLYGLFHLIRDRMVTPKGYLTLFFRRDLAPVSFRDSSDELRRRNIGLDHVSFGHDIETAYLLLEASKALGLRHDTITLKIAKKMVDHSLRYGWDSRHGGLFDGGYYFKGNDTPAIVLNTKEWWAQLEALNSSLMMSRLFPGDSMNYRRYFTDQWIYCETYLLDHRHGGWYWGGTDMVPDNVTSPKSTIWKCNYHTSRALINCILRLQGRLPE